MTIDKAISLLKQYIDYNNPDVPDFYTMEEACEVVIKALEQQPCDDCISRQAAIVALDDRMSSLENVDMQVAMGFAKGIIHELPPVTPQPKIGSSSEKPNKWIPITSRPMTEEEKEHYKIHPDYRDECRIFNCKLPDDGQEVLISVCGGVEVDTFAKDGNDGCYFEGRDIDDVDAWMPLPQKYQPDIPTGAEGGDKE